MEKIKQCLFHAVKLLPYGFMLLIAMFIGYWAKNWIELILEMLLHVHDELPWFIG